MNPHGTITIIRVLYDNPEQEFNIKQSNSNSFVSCNLYRYSQTILDTGPTMVLLILLRHVKGHFQCQFGPLLSILANISETLHAVTNVCIKSHIQSHIIMIFHFTL